MSFLKKTIFIVYVFCIGNASFSWAQDKERFDKKFSEKYAFVKDLNDLSELPFIETSEDEAQRVLTTSSHFFAPFGTKLSEYQNRFFYQLFGVNCPANPLSLCYYLVAQGGYGSAITRVYGPIDLK